MDIQDIAAHRRRIIAEYLPELERCNAATATAAGRLGRVIGFEIRCGTPVWVAAEGVWALENSETQAEIFAHALAIVGAFFPAPFQAAEVDSAMKDLADAEQVLKRARERINAAADSESSSDPAGDELVRVEANRYRVCVDIDGQRVANLARCDLYRVIRALKTECEQNQNEKGKI